VCPKVVMVLREITSANSILAGATNLPVGRSGNKNFSYLSVVFIK
jgi:hypothetical protein